MEDHESSSSGMMVGMIIGGVVVFVLVVLLVLGGLFFWAMDVRQVGPPPAAANPLVAQLLVDEEAVAPQPPVAPVGPGVKVADPRTHLVGVWDAKTQEGGKATMDIRDDGSLRMTELRPGKASMVLRVFRWDVRADKDDVKIKIATENDEPNEHVVVFLENDRMVITTIDGLTYEKRPAAPKK